MAKAQLQNETIEKIILNLCDDIEKQGGFIHPDILFQGQHDNIGVYLASKTEEQGELMRVPHSFLVPYEEFALDIQGNDIVLNIYEDTAKHPKREVFETLIQLYNETNKLETHLQSCPWTQFSKSPETINYLLKARDGDDMDIIKKHIHQPEFKDELALLTFFKSRLLRCSLHENRAVATPVLVPVIELLNHHPQGAGYDQIYRKDMSYASLKCHQPIPDSHECYALYGRLDAMDTYFHYNFVGENLPFVRSIPLSLDLGDLGKLHVNAFNTFVLPKEIPEQLKDLAFYLPHIRIDHDKKEVWLSHLMIPQESAPFSMRRILSFIITSLIPDASNETLRNYLQQMETQIVHMNFDYYTQLEVLVNRENNSSQIKADILALARYQQQMVKNYQTIMTKGL